MGASSAVDVPETFAGPVGPPLIAAVHAPATLGFYCTRLRRFRDQYNGRELATLTPLEIDEHLASAGTGMSDSTRHHNCVALGGR